MRKVWQKFKDNNISFLSVHDELIFQSKDAVKAKALFIEILDKEFEYYKISVKAQVKPQLPPIENLNSWIAGY